MYSYEYPRPSVTADVVLFWAKGDKLRLLLIERLNEPFSGKWALPGGFVDKDEDLHDAAARELKEETGIDFTRLRQVGAYGKPGRDPRGHVITIAFTGLISVEPQLVAGDDAVAAKWFFVDELPPLAFDHEKIIKDAYRLIKSELADTIAKN
ncbi:MAG: NUDIX hydrolase [Bacteroidales bacterium]|jgi:8-oxo-dGTP diphosphatase|nr:NUDIX hydrolase [Bacteroidales bacterium]HBX88311.1 NUDIX hydrolase [Marinilabiliaceae bacterium]